MFKSPFRADKNPSFSIYAGGHKFKDHSTGECGDIFDFCSIANDCSRKESMRIIGELVGLENKFNSNSLPVTKIKKPTVSSVVERVFEIKPPDQPLERVGGVLHRFLERKHIKLSVFEDLYNKGYVSLENGVLNYNYSTGTKTRWDYNDSHSTRWSRGKASDALWLDDCIKDPNIRTLFITEGETDAMRLLSFGVSKGSAVVAMPAASWTPSPVLAGMIGNCRDVYLMFDNDEAGRKACASASEAICNNTLSGSVYNFVWFGSPHKDLCDLDWMALDHLLKLNGICP